MIEQLEVMLLEQLGEGLNLPIDAILLRVQSPAESVSDLSHQMGKAEEQVRLKVSPHDGRVVLVKHKVQRRQDLIHPLHILDPRVQLRVYEQYPGHHIGMRLDIRLLMPRIQLLLLALRLDLQLPLLLLRELPLLDRPGEEADLRPSPLDVLLDLLPDVLVLVVLVPDGVLLEREGVVLNGAKGLEVVVLGVL